MIIPPFQIALMVLGAAAALAGLFYLDRVIPEAQRAYYRIAATLLAAAGVGVAAAGATDVAGRVHEQEGAGLAVGLVGRPGDGAVRVLRTVHAHDDGPGSCCGVHGCKPAPDVAIR